MMQANKINILSNPEAKRLNKQQIDVVMYHDSCSDGFGSAFVIWFYYKKIVGIERANQIEFIPCNFVKEGERISDKVLDKLKNKNVIMCDFSYKADNMFELINASSAFMILDHHKTAKEDLEKIPSCLKIFDMDRSGVGITWDFFFENRTIPLFLDYIQDRDLWRNKLPNCQAFVSYFYEQKFDFELWETFLDDKKVENIIEIGKNWEDYKNILIEKTVDTDGLIDLLIRKETGKKMICGEEVEYTLFKTGKIKEKWLGSEYLELLKKKCARSTYLVFQEPSDKIEYDNIEGVVYKLNQYTIFFNDFSVKDPEKRLALNMSEISNQNAISFESKEDFAVLQFMNNMDDQI